MPALELQQGQPNHPAWHRYARLVACVFVFAISFWFFELVFSWPYSLIISFILVRAGSAWLTLRRKADLNDLEKRRLHYSSLALLVLIGVSAGLSLDRHLRPGDWRVHRTNIRESTIATAYSPRLNSCLSRHPNIHRFKVAFVHIKGFSSYHVEGAAPDNASVDELVRDLGGLDLPFPVSISITVEGSLDRTGLVRSRSEAIRLK